MARGWIKLERAVLDHECLQEPDELGLWARFLAMAVWRDTKARVNGQDVTLKRGQLAFSVAGFAAKRRTITRKRLRSIIGLMRANGMIETDQAKGHAFTIVTVCNFDKYQTSEDYEGQLEGQERANQGPTKGQPRAKLGPTDKESKNPVSVDTDAPIQARSLPIANWSGAEAEPDLKTLVYRRAKGMLGPRSGGIITEALKDLKSVGRLAEVVEAMERERPIDPIPWFKAAVKARKPKPKPTSGYASIVY